MFDRLLIAYDGSEYADAAVELAFKLASGRGAEVALAHVLELPDPYPGLPQVAPGLERMIELAEEDWEARLTAVAAGAPKGVSVEMEVLTANKPAPALLELLSRRGADMLVAGTHGVGGLKQAMLGSVSQQLLEHAPCSVLLVGDRPRLEGPSVVVAGLDGSEATPAVVTMAQRAATALSAQLVLAHVVDDRMPGFASIEATDALREWSHEQGQQILDQARAGISAPLESVLKDLREGRAKEELIKLCEERRPVLAVVGSRGRHGFKGLLLGSTAYSLVNNAPCPVLIVRTPSGEHIR